MSKIVFDVGYLEERLLAAAAILCFEKHKRPDYPHVEKTYSNVSVLSSWWYIEKTLMLVVPALRIILDFYKEAKAKLEYRYNEVEKGLDYREACNKIIHALDICPEKVDGYLTGLVFLKGKKNNKTWDAEIDLNKFIANSLYILVQYDENWAISSRNGDAF